MSKQFHDVRNAKKMLAYGSRNGIGRFKAQRKRKTALSAANTQDGKAEKMPTQHNSASILPETKEGCQV